MRLETLPRRLVIIGGGFVAAEFAHVFASFGVEVTQVVRGRRAAAAPRRRLAAAFTDDRPAPLRPAAGHRRPASTRHAGRRDRAQDAGPAGVDTVDADVLLRRHRPGTELGPAEPSTATGVEVDRDGAGRRRRVPADRPSTASTRSATSARRTQLKHVANHEARVVRHNLLNPDDGSSPTTASCRQRCSPQPQIASVGLTEEQAKARGIPYVTGGAAIRRHRRRLGEGGHHRIRQGARRSRRPACSSAPTSSAREAATVIQPLIQAMSLRPDAHDDGPRAVLDPPGDARGHRERPAAARLRSQ